MKPSEIKIPTLTLAALGLIILGLDISADLAFFSEAGNQTLPLIGSAVVRNLLTVVAVVAIFRNEWFAAALLIVAAVLGLWRRVLYVSGMISATSSPDWLLYTAGLDTGFRLLLLGFAGGYLLGRKGSEPKGL